MSVVRDIWVDLVDKRLWPVALLLVIALIGVPVMLGKGADNSPAATRGAASAVPDALVVRATEQHIGLFTGRAHDPFRPQGFSAASASATSTATATATGPTGGSGPSSAGAGGTGTTGSGGSGGSSGGSHSGGGSGPTTNTTGSGVAPHGPKELEVVVRFGVFGTQLPVRSYAALEALPPASHPFLIYLGRAKDGKTAIFSVAGDVVATGDGDCRPNESLCQFIKLKPGDVESLVVTTADGKSVEYELELLSYAKK